MAPIDNSGSNNISDVRPDANNNPDISPIQIPIRGEKRIIPTTVDAGEMSAVFESALGDDAPDDFYNGRSQLVEPNDFYIAAALEPFVDYVIIRLQNRGISTTGQASSNLPAVYRFLINPAQVQISRQTLDGQAMARSGWQIGVWGEDMIQITLVGKSAGQYWSFGRTDAYQAFTESYRNLEQLQMVFENNGYWFEGEQAGEGPLAADFTRRRIKMHQDIELIVGNFVWFGMFDTLTITQSAEEPWLASFTLVFIAWKEQFRSGSPYQNLMPNNLQRGHSYSAWAASPINAANGVPSNAATTAFLPPTQAVPQPQSVPQPPVSPTITSAAQENTLPDSFDPSAADYTPMQNVLNSGFLQYSNYWNGVL